MKRVGAMALGMATLLLAGFGCGQRVAERAIENSIERETGGNANVDVSNGGVRVETKDGSFQAGAGAGLPSDWPSDVPLMPGAQVQYSGTSNKDKGSGVVFTTTKTLDEVVAFYRDQLTASGWTVQSSGAIANFTALTATKGEVGLSFAVQAAAPGQTTVTIGIDR